MLITDLKCSESPSGGLSEQLQVSGEQRTSAMWQQILENYDKTDPKEISNRLREGNGIPPELRSAFWRRFTETTEFKAKFGTDVYQKLVDLPCPFADKIEVDLHRTFPNHSLFKESHGRGQSSLRRVMIAYSNYDCYVGYCQGMSFLAGILLMQLNEEETFYALVQITCKCNLRGIYQPGLPGLKLHLQELDYQLKFCFPDLHAHLAAEGIDLQMFAANWFITVFVYTFPLATVLHIWDIFLFEGMDIVFRYSLAILKLCRARVLKMTFEEILPFFKRLPEDVVSANNLILCALNMDLDQPHLDNFFQTYNTSIPSSLLDQPDRHDLTPVPAESEFSFNFLVPDFLLQYVTSKPHKDK